MENRLRKITPYSSTVRARCGADAPVRHQLLVVRRVSADARCPMHFATLRKDAQHRIRVADINDEKHRDL